MSPVQPNVSHMPPPQRWLVEMDTNDDGDPVATVVDVTGQEDPCYIIGQDSPWIGSTLEQLEAWAKDGEYAPCSYSVIAQIQAIRYPPQPPIHA